MNLDAFEVTITGRGDADVYLCAGHDDIPWDLVESLDRAGVQVVGPPVGASVQAERAAHLIPSCSGVLTTSAPGVRTEDVDVPMLHVDEAEGPNLGEFVRAVTDRRGRIRAYAFVIGRLERDFHHARTAIRTAVENAAGMACVWADDVRLRTNVASVSLRTQLLIKHAQFIIADLTLGAESPWRENPSRAHEVGMAIAYERPLMLCSREPRRSPYFSIQDLQMSFWSNEGELAQSTVDWIDAHREVVSRQVFNHQLGAPKVAVPRFVFDPDQSFAGPQSRPSPGLRRLWPARRR